jgi:hypothetical protein
MSKAMDKLELAKRHLERVQSAWDEPTDWDDLSLYGFYCLEAAVEAAALHLRLGTSKKHWGKVAIALKLHKKQGLPDISELLSDLNEARKAAAYGDTEWPDLDAEGIASDIEEYVDAVTTLLTKGKNE